MARRFLKSGFTLLELIVVIVILGVIISLATISLTQANAKTRDVKRIADIKQIQAGLEKFLNEEHRYPTTEEFSTAQSSGKPLIAPTSGQTILDKIPANPMPRTDGKCANQDYVYSSSGYGNYAIKYCLGSSSSVGDGTGGKGTTNKGIDTSGTVSAGGHEARPEGLAMACNADCSGKCGGSMDGCGNICNNSCDDGYDCVSGFCRGWQQVGSAGLSMPTYTGNKVSLFVDGIIPYMIYTTADETKIVKYGSSGWSNLGLIPTNLGAAGWAKIFVSKGNVYVAMNNRRYAYATVYKFDGKSWQELSGLIGSGEYGAYLDLFVDNNIPYVSYQSDSNASKIRVKKYENSSWQSVGPNDASVNIGGNADTAIFVSNGVPYLGYFDTLNGSAGTGLGGMVFKYNSQANNWEAVGGSFSGGRLASLLSMYVDNGQPYVFHAYGMSAKHYVGNSWKNMNFSGLTPTGAGNSNITVDNGIVYTAYCSSNYSNNIKKLVVKKYVNSSWADVGNISAACDGGSGLYVANGVVYVAYSDYNNGNRVTVMKYDIQPSSY